MRKETQPIILLTKDVSTEITFKQCVQEANLKREFEVVPISLPLSLEEILNRKKGPRHAFLHFSKDQQIWNEIQIFSDVFNKNKIKLFVFMESNEDYLKSARRIRHWRELSVHFRTAGAFYFQKRQLQQILN